MYFIIFESHYYRLTDEELYLIIVLNFQVF